MELGHLDTPIDVLFRADGLCYEALTFWSDVLAKRELHEDAADFCIVVETLDCGDNIFDGARGWERNMVEFNADLLRSLCLHADIDGRVRALASLYDGELGLKARVFCLEGSDTGSDTIADCPGTVRQEHEHKKEGNERTLL